jgi:hypothetical protein
VISARGYVINIVKRSDEHLFSLDDAFMLIHKVFAERQGAPMLPEQVNLVLIGQVYISSTKSFLICPIC